MSEDRWHRARLIPTTGMEGAGEQERRAASVLLAVIGAVPGFGRAVTQALGAPAGEVETFVEVAFTRGDRPCVPAGVIQVHHGRRTWTALVEIRTGSAVLDVHGVEECLGVAREHGFDAVLTISNELPGTVGPHPVAVDRRTLVGVDLHHYPWADLLAAAITQLDQLTGQHPDQAWVLDELIRYLEHPRSGALEFEDLGPSWAPVRDAVRSGTAGTIDLGGLGVAERFAALLRYASLRLGRRIGQDVVTVRADPLGPGGGTLADGTLAGTIRIPDAGPIVVTADLRAGTVTCRLDTDGPDELGVCLSAPLGGGRGRGPGSVIDSVLDAIDIFHTDVVRRLPGPAAGGVVPEPREPVFEVDLREPVIPPNLPSRREVRLVRRLGSGPDGPSAARPAAGWYQDPSDVGRLRWWDGADWSERTYPAPATPRPQPGLRQARRA